VSVPLRPFVRDAPWLDGTGATIGLLCAVHCMAFPLIIGMLPLLGRLGEEQIEHTLIGMALLVGTGAAVLGWRRHRDRRLLSLFAIGLVLLALSTTIEGNDAWLLVPASGLVAGAHLWSARLGRQLRCSAARRH
jgi:predicted MFS family arabinose efflux permease